MSFLESEEEKRRLKVSTQFKFRRKLTEVSEIAAWLENNMKPEVYEVSGYIDTDGAELTITFKEQESAAKFRLFYG